VSAALAAVLLPLLAAAALGFFLTPLRGAQANLAVCILLFGITLAVPASPGGGMLHADRLGAIFGILTGFVGLTTAAGNIAFVRSEIGQMSLRRWRVYHAMGQMLLGCVLLGLYADNIGLLWVAVEAATIAASLGVSLPRTASALEAAWKYFILGGVGIALALFGSMVTYLAAQQALGPGLVAMSFAALTCHAAQLDGRLMTLGFVFLLFGYGTKAALAPLHGWLPDAYAEGPAPLCTALSGLMLNVPLIAILRFGHLMQGSFDAGGGAMRPGPFLVALGLASLLLTAFSLWRRRDARRFFGFSSIEHGGLAAFAFGIGGATAIFAGLLHMLLHTLIKSALFQVLARAAALRGGAGPGNYGFSRLRGLPATNKTLGWLLAGCVFGLTGMPPGPLFTSEFLIIEQTILRQPLLVLPLGLGLVVAAIAVIRVIGPLLHAPPPNPVQRRAGGDIWLPGLHLLAALMVGFAMPGALVRALSAIAQGLQ
jgi:hydrogenase-4 component F